jgi:hypothetical protein
MSATKDAKHDQTRYVVSLAADWACGSRCGSDGWCIRRCLSCGCRVVTDTHPRWEHRPVDSSTCANMLDGACTDPVTCNVTSVHEHRPHRFAHRETSLLLEERQGMGGLDQRVSQRQKHRLMAYKHSSHHVMCILPPSWQRQLHFGP